MVIKVVHMVQTVVLKKIKDPVTIYNHSFPKKNLKEDEITSQKITGFFIKIVGFFFFFFFEITRTGVL
jgi:hypothetical protein